MTVPVVPAMNQWRPAAKIGADRIDTTIRLFSAVACRCAGLPFARLAALDAPAAAVAVPFDDALATARAALWAGLDDPLAIDCLATQAPGACLTYHRRRRESPSPRPTSYRRLPGR
jgi:hypothetical protein